MKKWLLIFLAIGACAQASSPLEEAAIESNELRVKLLLKDKAFGSLSYDEKERILYRAYASSLDVIQEERDSMQVWNSWPDIIKTCIGGIGLPALVASIHQNDFLGAGFFALWCYVGIRGLQCKAQQDRLTTPLAINAHLEKAIKALEETKS